MKRFLYSFLLCLIVSILLTGCGLNNNKLNVTTNDSKSSCEVIDCINQIKVENTVDEIKNIIGFDGELTDEKYNKYYWKLSEDEGVEVTYYSSDKGTIKIYFDKNSVANKNVDFSKYQEIKSLLDNGTSLTYNEFVSKVGGIEGTLIEKSAYSKKYIWVNLDGGYLNASFSETSGKCTIVTGRY